MHNDLSDAAICTVPLHRGDVQIFSEFCGSTGTVRQYRYMHGDRFCVLYRGVYYAVLQNLLEVCLLWHFLTSMPSWNVESNHLSVTYLPDSKARDSNGTVQK